MASQRTYALNQAISLAFWPRHQKTFAAQGVLRRHHILGERVIQLSDEYICALRQQAFGQGSA